MPYKRESPVKSTYVKEVSQIYNDEGAALLAISCNALFDVFVS